MIHSLRSYWQVLLLALTVCLDASAHAQTAAEPTPPPAQTDVARPVVSDSYRLGTADKVRIIVFNEPTLSGEFIVGDGGRLSLPLIGDIAAAGRSASEVTAEIQRRLADGYLRDPRVSMDVLTYRPFYILGEVSKPGEYPYASGLTVMNAVARAEGFTYRANRKKVFIKHAGDTTETQVKLSADLAVAPGDTIRIGERYF